MQGYNVKVGALIVSESGGDLSLIKIEYKDDKGNDNTIYIDATQWWLINRSTNLNATLFVWDAGQKQKQG